MNDGYWLNYETNEYFPIHEHENWLRSNYFKLGVNPDDLKQFEPVKDRIECLLYILQKYPLIRVRENGISITFEFMTDYVNEALWSIYMFCKKVGHCGDYTGLKIVNINKDSTYLIWSEFQNKMKNDEVIIRESVNKKTSLMNIFPGNAEKFIENVKYKSKFNILFESIFKELHSKE